MKNDENQAYKFPNYFHAIKTQAKISKQEEQDGVKKLLEFDKNGKSKKAIQQLKNRQRKPSTNKNKKSKFNGGKAYLTEIEDCDASMNDYDPDREDDNVDLKDSKIAYIKNIDLKKKNLERLVKNNFNKMKFRLDCGFNLLIYGVGSKYDFINLFCQK